MARLLMEQQNQTHGEDRFPQRWKPGQSGNPRGRPPRGETMTDLLKRLAEVQFDDARSKREAICEIMLRKAAEGEPWAVRETWDRIEGKPAVHIEVSKKDDLLRGMSDAEVLDMIERANQKRLGNDNDVNA